MKKNSPLSALFILLILPFSLSGQTVSVVGDSIFYYPNANVEYSNFGDESTRQAESGRALEINLQDHVVLRGAAEKISFNPLYDANQTRINENVYQALSVKLPAGLAKFATLYQRFHLVNNQSEQQCKVIVLHRLMSEGQLAKLIFVLTESGTETVEHNDFVSFDCKNSVKGHQ